MRGHKKSREWIAQWLTLLTLSHNGCGLIAAVTEVTFCSALP